MVLKFLRSGEKFKAQHYRVLCKSEKVKTEPNKRKFMIFLSYDSITIQFFVGVKPPSTRSNVCAFVKKLSYIVSLPNQPNYRRVSTTCLHYHAYLQERESRPKA